MDGPCPFPCPCRATGACSIQNSRWHACEAVTVECEPGCLLGRLLPTAAAPHGACPALFWPGSRTFRLSQRPRLSPGTRCLLRCGCVGQHRGLDVFRCWHLAAHHVHVVREGIERSARAFSAPCRVQPRRRRKLTPPSPSRRMQRNATRGRGRSSLAGDQPRTGCRARPAVPTATRRRAGPPRRAHDKTH